VDLPEGAGKIRGLIGAYDFSGVITECGNLFIFGTLPCSLVSQMGNSIRKIPEFKVHVPGRKEELWKTVFQWWFLGSAEKNSGFSNLPVEVVYHIVTLFHK
jgi:hypothetical protein